MSVSLVKPAPNAFQCPRCLAAVRVDNLNYRANVQRTECPKGHPVYRVWNGPEREDWAPNTPGEPYGWSLWKPSRRA